jgi:hypothetical protein
MRANIAQVFIMLDMWIAGRVREILPLRFDCVDRRKLDFFNAAKLLLWGHVRGEEVTFAGGQDNHAWSICAARGDSGEGGARRE